MIKQTFLNNNDCFKEGRYITPKGLMLHSVGCSYSKASGFVESWNKPGFMKCVHAFIDSNDGVVWQTLPWNMRGWHAGGYANNTHIGVEMCESEFITYVDPEHSSDFTVDIPNIKKVQAQITLAYYSAVALFADLCEQYRLDPLKDGVVISHSEGYKRGIASNHTDPVHIWSGLGLPFTMDGFRKDVYKTMANRFIDVPPGAWYADAVNWCYDHGIIKGVDKTHFNPDGNMTRAEMATVIYRLYQSLTK